MAINADQVVVEVTALVSSYSKAMAKIATDTRRHMTIIEEVTTKAEVTVRRSFESAAAASEQGSRRRAKAAADMVAAEQAMAGQTAATADRIGLAAERTAVRVENATRLRTKLLRDAAAAEREVADGAARQAAAGGPATASRLGGGLLGLARVFGPASVIIEAVANGLQIADFVMNQFAGSASANADDLERFNSALEDSRDSAGIAEEGYDAVIRKLAQLTETSRRALVAQLQQGIEQNEASLRSGAQDLSGAVTAEENWRRIIEVVGGTGESAFQTRKEIADLAREIKEAPNDHSNYSRLADILRSIASSADSETAESFLKLANRMDAAAGDAEALVEKSQRLETVQRLANGEIVRGAKAVLDSGTNADTASGQYDGFSGSVERLGLSFRRLAAARNIGFGSVKGFGFIQGEILGERQADPDSPGNSSPSTLGPLFPGFDLGSLGQDVVWQSPFNFGSNSSDGRPLGAAGMASRTEEDEARLQKLAEAQRLYEETLTPLERYFQAQDRILMLHDALRESLGNETAAQEVMNRALVEAAEAYGKTQESADKTDEATKRQKELSDAFAAVGDVFKDGIKGAKDFNDALDSIALGLLDLAGKGLFGQGALGGVFNQLLGVDSGGAGLLSWLAGPSDASSGGASGGGVWGGIGSLFGSLFGGLFGGGRASGGQVLPGQLYEVGETGREWFAPTVPGQVIPNHVIKAAAGGGGGSNQPITFNISMAGANGDRTIAEIAAAAVRKGLTSVPEINRQHRIRFA